MLTTEDPLNMESSGDKSRPKSMQITRSRMAIFAFVGLALLAVGASAFWVSTCPCEQIPGAYLSGDRVEEPIENWSFANQVQLCQIQTNSGIIPHAINLNCAADINGNLFLSCAQCDGKRWSTAAMLNPAAHIRLDGLVYPVTLRRVEESLELDNAWSARALKLMALRGETPSEVSPRPAHWWSFQVTSRS